MAPAEAVRAVSAVYLLLPQIPMLFMGEEWNAADPFIFFCDFKGELAKAIREGRRKEFAAFPAFREAHGGKQIPDPDDPETFARSRLDWDAPQKPDALVWRDRYRGLLEVRHREIVPRIPLIGPNAARAERLGPSVVRVTWSVGTSEELVLVANLSASPGPKVAKAGRVIWQEGTWNSSDRLEAWAVLWGIRSL
jgi:maltooligosyltrehalose trehalohydrolase